MNRLIKNTTGSLIGLTLALVAGAPALADDTELLLIDPNNVQPKPNIMFIIDSSGSMTTQEQTQEPYNAATPYSGPCNPDMVYWTEVDAVPATILSRCQEYHFRRVRPALLAAHLRMLAENEEIEASDTAAMKAAGVASRP